MIKAAQCFPHFIGSLLTGATNAVGRSPDLRILQGSRKSQYWHERRWQFEILVPRNAETSLRATEYHAVRDPSLRRHTIDFPADLRTRLRFTKTNEASSMDSFANSRVRIVDRAPQNNGKSILRTTVAEELCVRPIHASGNTSSWKERIRTDAVCSRS